MPRPSASLSARAVVVEVTAGVAAWASVVAAAVQLVEGPSGLRRQVAVAAAASGEDTEEGNRRAGSSLTCRLTG